MVCLYLNCIHVLWEDPLGCVWEEMGHQDPSLMWISSHFGVCNRSIGRLCPKPHGRQHTWVKVSSEVPVSVSPVAAEPRAGLGLFLTLSAAEAGRVAVPNPAVAT